VPLYTYTCMNCDITTEKIVMMLERDNARCDECGYSLIRNIDRPGLVWSPTKNGGHSV